MDQQSMPQSPDGLLQPIQPKSHWFLAYKGLSLTLLLLIVAVIALILFNLGHGTNKKVVTKSPNTVDSSPVSVWNGNYGNLIVSLNNDINNINAQVGDQSYTGQETACQQLATDVAATSAAPAIPNTSAQGQLTSGLSYLQQAAISCISGTQIYLNQADNSKPVIELQAVNDLKTFTDDLQLGTTQIQDLTNTLKTLSK